MTRDLQSKNKRGMPLNQNLCDLEHFWQLVNLERNWTISTVYLLKDKLRATLQFGNGKVWMHNLLNSLWKSQRHNPKNLFPVEAMVAPELVTPSGSRAQRPSTEQTTLFPGNHLLLQVTGEIKLFLECLEKCRPNPFVILELGLVRICLAKLAKLQHIFSSKKKIQGKKEIIDLHKCGLEMQIYIFTRINTSKM